MSPKEGIATAAAGDGAPAAAEEEQRAGEIIDTCHQHTGMVFRYDKDVGLVQFKPCLSSARFLYIAYVIEEFMLLKIPFKKITDVCCDERSFLLNGIITLPGYVNTAVCFNKRLLRRAAERPLFQLHQDRRATDLLLQLVDGDFLNLPRPVHLTDALCLTEYIQHVEVSKMGNLIWNIFGEIEPKLVVITTPNTDFNVHFPLPDGKKFRHVDHQFEWSSSELERYCTGVTKLFTKYFHHIDGIGLGKKGIHATQIAIFIHHTLEVKPAILNTCKGNVVGDLLRRRAAAQQERKEGKKLAHSKNTSMTDLAKTRLEAYKREKRERDQLRELTENEKNIEQMLKDAENKRDAVKASGSRTQTPSQISSSDTSSTGRMSQMSSSAPAADSQTLPSTPEVVDQTSEVGSSLSSPKGGSPLPDEESSQSSSSKVADSPAEASPAVEDESSQSSKVESLAPGDEPSESSQQLPSVGNVDESSCQSTSGMGTDTPSVKPAKKKKSKKTGKDSRPDKHFTGEYTMVQEVTFYNVETLMVNQLTECIKGLVWCIDSHNIHYPFGEKLKKPKLTWNHLEMLKCLNSLALNNVSKEKKSLKPFKAEIPIPQRRVDVKAQNDKHYASNPDCHRSYEVNCIECPFLYIRKITMDESDKVPSMQTRQLHQSNIVYENADATKVWFSFALLRRYLDCQNHQDHRIRSALVAANCCRMFLKDTQLEYYSCSIGSGEVEKPNKRQFVGQCPSSKYFLYDRKGKSLKSPGNGSEEKDDSESEGKKDDGGDAAVTEQKDGGVAKPATEEKKDGAFVKPATEEKKYGGVAKPATEEKKDGFGVKTRSSAKKAKDEESKTVDKEDAPAPAEPMDQSSAAETGDEEAAAAAASSKSRADSAGRSRLPRLRSVSIESPRRSSRNK